MENPFLEFLRHTSRFMCKAVRGVQGFQAGPCSAAGTETGMGVVDVGKGEMGVEDFNLFYI